MQKTIVKSTMDFQSAMDQYCSDKPDLRNPLIVNTQTELFHNIQFNIIQKLLQNGAQVKTIKIDNILSNSQYKKITNYARSNHFECAYIYKNTDKITGPLAKFFIPRGIIATNIQ